MASTLWTGVRIPNLSFPYYILCSFSTIVKHFELTCKEKLSFRLSIYLVPIGTTFVFVSSEGCGDLSAYLFGNVITTKNI